MKLTASTPGDRDLIVTRPFRMPATAIFQAWTVPALLKQWMVGPDGWAMTRCDLDLRVGGAYRIEWRHTKGQQMGMSGVYKTFDPPRRIAMTELFDEDWTGGETLNTIDLVEANGITTLTQTVRYASAKGRAAALATPMLDGMAEGYDKLEALITEGAAS